MRKINFYDIGCFYGEEVAPQYIQGIVDDVDIDAIFRGFSPQHPMPMFNWSHQDRNVSATITLQEEPDEVFDRYMVFTKKLLSIIQRGFIRYLHATETSTGVDVEIVSIVADPEYPEDFFFSRWHSKDNEILISVNGRDKTECRRVVLIEEFLELTNLFDRDLLFNKDSGVFTKDLEKSLNEVIKSTRDVKDALMASEEEFDSFVESLRY